MTAFEAILITTTRCAKVACPDCAKVERALRGAAEARGIPVPAVARGGTVGVAAGIGGLGTIVVRHASCDEAADLLGAHESPVLLVNGRVVLSGAGWAELELGSAIRQALDAEAR